MAAFDRNELMHNYLDQGGDNDDQVNWNKIFLNYVIWN